MFFATTELDDFVNRYNVPLLESKAYQRAPRVNTRSTPVGNCEDPLPKRPSPISPRRKPRVKACVTDCAPSISQTFFAEGSATASVRAVSDVPVDAKANETGTAPTSMLPADCIESRLTIPMVALCGSTTYAFFESIWKSDANGAT